MKYRAKIFLSAFIVLGLSIQAQAEEAISKRPCLLKRLFCTLSWKETVQVVGTPQKAVSAVNRHIKYKPDITDCLAEPEEAWKKGYGDCEDTAYAIVKLCHEKGFNAWVQVFYSSDSFTAHAVAMGRIDGQLWIANGRFREVKDMKEAENVVASSMRWKKQHVSSTPWSHMNINYNVACQSGAESSSQKPVKLASINP